MVRQAQLTDFDAIDHIRKSVALDTDKLRDATYRVHIQRNGFLFPTGLRLEDFRAALPNYSVAELEGQVVGYFRLRDNQDIPFGTKVAWLKPELEEIYWSKPHTGLDGIGVLPQVKQRGMATEMLQAVEQQVQARGGDWVFSFVVVTSVTNFASMMFHEKNGFERAAILGPDEYVGENNFHLDVFQSFLYGKQLS